MLAFLTWLDHRQERTLPNSLTLLPAGWALIVLVLIAVIYTTPWDNYLVATEVWWYDPASVTGQVASGCNVVTFTTGRGSAFGYKPAPSIKLATNTPMYERMREDMDINCGDVLDGTSIEDKGAEILERVLAVASGERTRSEILGYGDNEFVPWQIGAVM